MVRKGLASLMIFKAVPLFGLGGTYGYYVNAIEWYDLSQELKQGNYDVSPAFQEQFEKWGYDTNSLILLARKKNNNEH